jgi:HTH-type transcriptional regulator / antitoxin MqsA
MESRDNEPCPLCESGTLHDNVREETVHYRNQRFMSLEPGAYCDACGDGFAYDNPEGEARWIEFRAAVDQTEREELAAIRARLGLTQLEASQITGGGKNAFSRYECAKAQPVVGIYTLFRILDKYPCLLAEFNLAPPGWVPVAMGLGNAQPPTHWAYSSGGKISLSFSLTKNEGKLPVGAGNPAANDQHMQLAA